ncbi:DUF2789 domain-containing protein [Pigmentiphaga litoralis]|jgi:hypothetical protein|uniref:DUF2789 domain-containing protein n=1 Tax=Pigmentiphaga litoralis TaxID=516702 RepID=UPI001679329E|nr:DUF2789 domain-containing protein [Pigmentiphaga litoralis]
MDDSEISMTNLFLQLGLDAENDAIAEFIKTHQLPNGTDIYAAPFWSDSQRQFLHEQLKADAPWALIVDQLNEALKQDGIKQETGV